MADNASLLSFIARRHTVGREDVATDALSFILSRSNSAKRALSDLLGDDAGPCRSRQRGRGGRMPLELYQIWHASTRMTTWSP